VKTHCECVPLALVALLRPCPCLDEDTHYYWLRGQSQVKTHCECIPLALVALLRPCPSLGVASRPLPDIDLSSSVQSSLELSCPDLLIVMWTWTRHLLQFCWQMLLFPWLGNIQHIWTAQDARFELDIFHCFF
jgi:hypothetical protein